MELTEFKVNSLIELKFGHTGSGKFILTYVLADTQEFEESECSFNTIGVWYTKLNDHTLGLGKMTFCQLLCDANVNGLSGPKSATQEIDIREENKFCYIDTPGFNNSYGKTDKKTFRKILSKF
ncbi:unnamed protein product [Rhizophagus irregularis]|nr:unnamed protein product [Rhizophagus irregularis]